MPARDIGDLHVPDEVEVALEEQEWVVAFPAHVVLIELDPDVLQPHLARDGGGVIQGADVIPRHVVIVDRLQGDRDAMIGGEPAQVAEILDQDPVVGRVVGAGGPDPGEHRHGARPQLSCQLQLGLPMGTELVDPVGQGGKPPLPSVPSPRREVEECHLQSVGLQRGLQLGHRKSLWEQHLDMGEPGGGGVVEAGQRRAIGPEHGEVGGVPDAHARSS